jgi:hypothetical protein
MTMGKLYTVWCDGPADGGRHRRGCPSWIGNEETSQAARTKARRAKWQRVPKNAPDGPADRSPACAT